MARSGYIQLPTHASSSTSLYIPTASLTSRLFELLRSGCLAALVGLHAYGVVKVIRDKDEVDHSGRHGKGRGHGVWYTYGAEVTVESVFLGVYAILLAHSLFLVIKARSTPIRRIASFLLNTISILTASFFLYRDVYPLATYSQHPTDPIYLPTPIVWTRIALISFAALVIPLIQPRIYTPIDPANPAEKPHPRQTVSIFSRMFFMYMDPVVLYAWRNPQIEYKDLPPAPDSDRAAYLFADVIPELDPFERKRRGLKHRSILTLILIKFWSVYSNMALMMFLKAALEFLSPVALNELLRSLQHGAEPSYFRPWVWVVLLGAGPLSSSLTMAYYQVLATTNLVRLECVFSELLFTHALRIKMQDSSASSGETPAAPITPLIQVEEGEIMLKGEDLGEANNQDGARPQDESSSGSSDGDQTKVNEGSATPAPVAAKAEPKDKEASIVGRINTLMTADIDNVLEAREILSLLIYSPIQIIIGTVFLYQILSWSALVGMAVSILTLPLPGYLSTILQKVQKELMKATDHRVQAVTEVLGTIRMVKLFAWEPKVKEQLSDKRDKELHQIKRRQIWGTVVGGVAWILPVLTMVVCYGLYTVVEGGELTAAKVFSSLTVFDMVRGQMFQITQQLQTLITAKVSLHRLDDFLSHTEMLDRHENAEISEEENAVAQERGIFFKNATFYWESAARRVAGQRHFRLHIDNVVFPEGQITLVAGPTGCGKSSLLMALLGELAFEPSGLDSEFNLPRKGGVAYAAQESWVMAETVRENILFGTPYEEERYKMVIDQCALEKDLELFAAGDATELGEKGLNASGGQKARISLARAFYSKASIVLLDDVLSALDVHTTQYIIDNLLKGPLAVGRTIILVTHHVSLCSQVADQIVNLSINGTVLSQGTVDKAKYLQSATIAASLPITTEGEVSAEALVEAAEGEEPAAKEAVGGKLVVAEEKNMGRVSRRALWEYFTSAGGPIFWTLYYLNITLGEFLFAYCNYWLGLWSKAYDNASNPRDVSTLFWMGIYVALMLLQVGSYNSTSIMWMFGAMRAARKLHARLVDSILSANMRFLDQTPTGRLVGRFTKDIGGVDTRFVRMFQGLSEIVVTMLMKFVLLIWLVPVFAPYALLTGIAGLIVSQIFIKAQLSIKREMSNAKTPLYTQFSAASNGLVSIRAYGAEERFKYQLGDKADAYTGTAIMLYDTNRAMGIRIDLLGASFALVLSAVLVYRPSNLDVFVVGFAINQAVSFAEILLHAVRMSNEFEIQANGIERIHDYINIEHEPPATEKGKPPASWPTDGKITMDKLSARYYPGGPTVLKELSLTVDSGARVGIVGRTGSGKSTLTLALLRMIPTEGTCTISGMDISKVNLESIRSHITIIPQDPVLLSGSLRFNLDPFDQHDDATLNDALDVSGLTSARLQGTSVGTATPMNINLDTNISSGGGNLSQGQRQLVSLARALVRGSKILILDEATASVDFATDALVQKAIRNLHDITILTVAHRLSSVMDYEKILVLGAGEVLEYASPYELLQKKAGHLRAMVDKATNKKELEELAEPREKS